MIESCIMSVLNERDDNDDTTMQICNRKASKALLGVDK